MHTMAFDSLIPVFLHYPEQQMHGNPNVQLPFKFIGGFGVGRLPYQLHTDQVLTTQTPKQSASTTP